VVRVLAATSAILALLCVWLAFAWERERTEALCWRAASEDGAAPAEGDCHRPFKVGPLPILR